MSKKLTCCVIWNNLELIGPNVFIKYLKNQHFFHKVSSSQKCLVRHFPVGVRFVTSFSLTPCIYVCLRMYCRISQTDRCDCPQTNLIVIICYICLDNTVLCVRTYREPRSMTVALCVNDMLLYSILGRPASIEIACVLVTCYLFSAAYCSVAPA